MSSKLEFNLSPNMDYFNASYGVVPKYVSDYHNLLILHCERNPYIWFTKKYKLMLTYTKIKLAPYLNTTTNSFVIVDNSSSAANSVFNSINFDEKSVIIVLETAYGLIDNLIQKQVDLYNCKVKIIKVNLYNIQRIKVDISAKIKEIIENDYYKIKLVCIDHISSCPGIVIPVCDIAQECKTYNIPVLVDGAHALGQVEIDLKKFQEAGVKFWFTDTHKWFFSPKGSALFWVDTEYQDKMFPTIDCTSISSKGCTVIQNDNKKITSFEDRFMYLGTKDYTPWIAINAAIDFIESYGGYRNLILRNHKLALWAQKYLAGMLESATLDDNLTASMSNIYLPFINSKEESEKLTIFLQKQNIFVVICEYNNKYWLRLCIQLFIDVTNIVKLKNALFEYKKLVSDK